MDQCTPSYSELDDIYKSERKRGGQPQYWIYVTMIISLGALSCTRLLSVFHGYHKSRSYVSPFPSTTMFCPTMGLDAMKPAYHGLKALKPGA